jgi:hypothetical protein
MPFDIVHELGLIDTETMTSACDLESVRGNRNDVLAIKVVNVSTRVWAAYSNTATRNQTTNPTTEVESHKDEANPDTAAVRVRVSIIFPSAILHASCCCYKKTPFCYSFPNG